MFRAFPLSIIRSFSLYAQHSYMSKFCWQQAACTVRNSWWWAKELSETCRVLLQKWIWEIRAPNWFYYKKILYVNLKAELSDQTTVFGAKQNRTPPQPIVLQQPNLAVLYLSQLGNVKPCQHLKLGSFCRCS